MPHFSVLTNPAFLPENLEQSIDAFWTSGQKEAEVVQRVLDRFGFGALETKRCVEYGCGVGRVTMPLTKLFREVVSYDISRAHLDLAEVRGRELGVTNLVLRLVTGDELPVVETCDFFYSRIVFQHNPPPLIGELVRMALAALTVGGVALFQIQTYDSSYRFDLAEYLDAPYTLGMEMHSIPQTEVFRLIAEAGCDVLEVRENMVASGPRGVLSTIFVVRRPAQ